MNTNTKLEVRCYLFNAHTLLHVVDFVVLDLAIAREGQVPAEAHSGGGRHHCLQVGSRSRHLDYNTERTEKHIHDKEKRQTAICSNDMENYLQFFQMIWKDEMHVLLR